MYPYSDDPACNAGNEFYLPTSRGSIFLEGVTVSVNCADFLAHTLPLNKIHFDRLIVVTAPEDKQTRKVCQAWGVECVLTDVFRARWGEFRKGAGINEGLKTLAKTDWLLHMDCDIVLPAHFRSTLELLNLDKSMIYGFDRAEFKSYEAWQAFFGDPEPQREHMFVNTSCTFGMPPPAT
jgi:hypothetical protein